MKIFRQDETAKLAEILKNDGVISVPTDTVYGLCACISSEKAYKKLLTIKNRPIEKAFPVMCADIEQIKSIAFVDERAEKLIHAFMPGPITLVLNKNPKISEYITNRKKTIAVRMATSETLRELIKKTDCPVFMSSANLSGKPTCSSLDEIEKTFPNLDGMMEGNVSFGKSSTIVDCTSRELEILRDGPISMEEILQIFKN